jgi:hypothetical protein
LDSIWRAQCAGRDRPALWEVYKRKEKEGDGRQEQKNDAKKENEKVKFALGLVESNAITANDWRIWDSEDTQSILNLNVASD